MKDARIVTEFRKSSYSGQGGGDCIEIARTADGGTAVRDSKRRDDAKQFYGPNGWAAFIAAVRTGSFDA
jgi:hypothetical protein